MCIPPSSKRQQLACLMRDAAKKLFQVECITYFLTAMKLYTSTEFLVNDDEIFISSYL